MLGIVHDPAGIFALCGPFAGVTPGPGRSCHRRLRHHPGAAADPFRPAVGPHRSQAGHRSAGCCCSPWAAHRGEARLHLDGHRRPGIAGLPAPLLPRSWRWLADLTREEHRIKAMAMIGMSIGLSFALAMVLGPVLNAMDRCAGYLLGYGGAGPARHRWWWGLWFPRRREPRCIGTPRPCRAQFGRVLRDGNLLRLDFGILMLH